VIGLCKDPSGRSADAHVQIDTGIATKPLEKTSRFIADYCPSTSISPRLQGGLLMATNNQPKKRRKHPDDCLTRVVHARLTPADYESLRAQSKRLGWSMGAILSTAVVFAERGEILSREFVEQRRKQQRRKQLGQRPVYMPGELTESEQQNFDIRRELREKGLMKYSW
jgi:hypothetical protein